MITLTTTNGRDVLRHHSEDMSRYLTAMLNVPSNLAIAMVEQLPDRLTARMIDDLGLSETDAEHRLNAGIEFLLHLGSGRKSVPDEVEDDLWHTFLLYSGEFEAFGMVTAGRVLRHFPNDVKGYSAGEDKCGSSCNGNGGYCRSCSFDLVAKTD